MNLQETLALLDRLNAVGAKHFKSSDLEVSLIGGPDTSYINRAPLTPPPAPPIETVTEQPYNPENTKQVENLIDLLQMKDEQLANQIFPEGA